MKASVKVRQETENLSLLVAVLLVLLTAIFTYRAWAAFERNIQDARTTRRFVDGTTSLLASLSDAESGQRGYLLTGSDRYLEPYRQALARIPGILDTLTLIDSSRTRPHQLSRIDRLRPLVQTKLDELSQTIDLRRTQGLDAALAVVREDRGRISMDQIRSICAEIQAASDDLLSRQRDEVRSSAYQAGLVGTFGSIAVFVLLVLATVTIRNGTRHRQRLIQDLQRSEEAARDARDLLQTTISSIGDGVITTDTEGKVVSLNPVAQSLTGWTQEQASGRALQEIFEITDEETGAAAENLAVKALGERTVAKLAGRITLRSKDGPQIPIEDSAAPISSADGQITGVVLVFRDISQRREAERAEKSAAAALARHSELLERTNAELQDFAYAASHDLREPLRTITAYTQLVQLRGGAQLDQKSAECLQFIVAAAERMGLLIDALLDYSRAGEVVDKPLRAVRMDEVLANVIGNLNGSIEENQAVITHDSLPAIMGDRTHLEQLLQNLIGNALKYRRPEAPRVHVAARDGGGKWVFSVSDNGQGIPPSTRPRSSNCSNACTASSIPGPASGWLLANGWSSAIAAGSGWSPR